MRDIPLEAVLTFGETGSGDKFMLVKNSLQGVMCSQNTTVKWRNKAAQKVQVELANSLMKREWSSAQTAESAAPPLTSHSFKPFNLRLRRETSSFFISLRLKRIYGEFREKTQLQSLFLRLLERCK